MAKRVVVTGASSGIGEATARLFASRGWEVLGVARRADRLERLATEAGIQVLSADLTNDDDVARVRERVEADGPLDALINNAGGAIGLDRVEDGDPAEWARMFDINVLGTQRMIKALLPSLRAGAEAHGHGDILSITSIAAHTAYEGGAGYNAAKFAQHALMAVLRLELAGEPLRVIEIAPGLVHTEEFSLTRFRGDQSKADAVYAEVPEPLSAQDVADSIVHAIELPGHINLDMITIKPVAQAAPHKMIKGPLSVRS